MLKYNRDLSVYGNKGYLRSAILTALMLIVSVDILAETDEQLMKSGQWRDNSTGLIWMRCSIGQSWNGTGCEGEPLSFLHREDADQYIHSMNSTGGFSGKRNWRISKIQELATLRKCSQGWKKVGDISLPEAERRRFGKDHDVQMKRLSFTRTIPAMCANDSTSPVLDLQIFPGTPPEDYWSSTKPSSYKYKAWRVDFRTGFVGRVVDGQESGRGFFRAVR